MTALITPLATAVVAELNSPIAVEEIEFTAFSQTFTATRVHNPEVKIEEIEDLSVQVQSGRSPSSPSGRDELERDCDVIIYLRQQVDATSLTQVDALIALLEEIDLYLFARKRLATLENCQWASSEITPVVPRQLRRAFYEGILIVTYRTFTSGE